MKLLHGAILLSLILLGYNIFIKAGELHASKHGDIVFAKVVANENACRGKIKHIYVHSEGRIRRVAILHPDCLEAEFPLNKVIRLRKNNQGGNLVLEKSNYRQSLTGYCVLFFITLCGGLFFLKIHLRARKKSRFPMDVPRGWPPSH